MHMGNRCVVEDYMEISANVPENKLQYINSLHIFKGS
jgi:hypothetical protein